MSDLVEQLRSTYRAACQEQTLYSGWGIMERAADEIERLRAIVNAIDELRAENRSSVQVHTYLATGGTLSEIVTVKGPWTNDTSLDFGGKTLVEALASAVKVKREAAKAEEE